MAAFGAYHGLNPGMGWLFALSRGLERRSERAIAVALIPIAAGHAASVALVAAVILALGTRVPPRDLEIASACVLLAFGAYKLRRYYRHPRWVGMQVSLLDLVWWSFLMATAHGAGLMIAPMLITISDEPRAASGPLALAVVLHTASMLVVMALVSWIVYKKVGLAVLRTSWVNFDLIWAVALLIVGAVALL
ncbi:MAG TPA: hypothetical protein VN607_12785 [Gemmatimonadaceae bacterium]|nr:hypothetical protein [Gemmatimonadaceae bacterium]